jgi:uncharacterized protein YhbP (UPF0306 family)
MGPQRFSLEQILDAIRRHLAARHICVLATCRADVPWAASSFYVSRDLDLYVCQGRHARTLENMRANPRTAFTVDDRQAAAWLQGIGCAGPVSPEDDRWAREALQVVAPEFTHHFTNPQQPVLLIRIEEVAFADRPGGIYPRQYLVQRNGSWEFAEGRA